MELQLKHLGEGRFQTASRLDFELSSKTFDQGEMVKAVVTKRRSVKQNNFFHALVEAAWDNQRGGPMLPTWRHLKSWLLINVGHCTVKEFSAKAMTPDVAAFFRTNFDTVDFSTNGRTIFVKIAKSVSFTKAEAEIMRKVTDDVVALICSDIVPGITADDLLTMAKQESGHAS
jgi:hypothetical protein